MNKNTASTLMREPHTFVGLDVHKETIAVAVADSGTASPRSFGVIRNDLDELRKTLRKIGSPATLRVCYDRPLRVRRVPFLGAAQHRLYHRRAVVDSPQTRRSD